MTKKKIVEIALAIVGLLVTAYLIVFQEQSMLIAIILLIGVLLYCIGLLIQIIIEKKNNPLNAQDSDNEIKPNIIIFLILIIIILLTISILYACKKYINQIEKTEASPAVISTTDIPSTAIPLITPTPFENFSTASPTATMPTRVIKVDGSLQGKIAAGNDFFIAVKDNFEVVCIGNQSNKDLSDFIDIIQVAAHGNNILGLRKDHTVVFAGISQNGEDNVTNWKEIKQVAVCNAGSLGLTTLGKMKFAGTDTSDIKECTKWSGIKEIFNGYEYIIALGNSGMLVPAGKHNGDGMKISAFTDVEDVCVSQCSTFILFSGGTVTSLNVDTEVEEEISNWKDIVAIVGGENHVVGLKSDGTVVAAGDDSYGQRDVESWTDIVAISAGQFFTVGVKSDGTIVATSYFKNDQSKIEDIDLW